MSTFINDNKIGYGTLDNIKMEKAGVFNEMTIFQSKSQNGEKATYTVEFKAKIPVSNKDIFYLVLPDGIDSPKEPECEYIKCLDQVASSCTSEKGRIVVELIIKDPKCLLQDAVFSFKVLGIQNAGSLLHSQPVQAYFQSESYSLIGEYKAEKSYICGLTCIEDPTKETPGLVIANDKPGYIEEKDFISD